MKKLGGTLSLTFCLALGAVGAGCGGGGSGRGGVVQAVADTTARPTPVPSNGDAGANTSPSGGSSSPAVGGTAPTTTSTSTGGTAPTTTSTSTGGTSTGGASTFDPATPSLGTNLNGVSYYSPELPFVDLMKTARVATATSPWELVNPNGLPAPTLDAQGYPQGLGSGQTVWTLVLRGLSGRYPAGDYVLLFDGQGEMQVSQDGGTLTRANDGAGTARLVIPHTPNNNGLMVRITRSTPGDHVRNIRLVMPGHEATYATRPFNPKFLERIAMYSTLRFMDWGWTNGSTVTTWSQRRRPDHFTQGTAPGVAWEHMAALCNTARKNAWICIPHKADDDYVRQLATLMKGALSPDLKLFIEYSNEVWNGQFAQHGWVRSQATAAGMSDWYPWYTRRAVQIFGIFEQVFGGRARLVRVIGSQSGNPWIGKQLMAALPSSTAADALAIAPYFGGSLGGGSQWQTTKTWTVAQVLDACEADLAKQRDLVRQNKAYASAAGLRLIAYEGGQHLAGVGAAVEDTTLVSLFVAANRAARMGDLYEKYLTDWAAEGGGLFVHFSDVYVPQKWGCWGALEYQDQTGACKHDALAAIAARWAQAAGAAGGQ